MNNIEQIQVEILTSLTNFMTASGIIKDFVFFRENFGNVSPIFCKDNQNVYYVTEFREGRKVKEFLAEQKSKYSNKDVDNLINNLIENWRHVVNHVLNYVLEEKKELETNK